MFFHRTTKQIPSQAMLSFEMEEVLEGLSPMDSKINGAIDALEQELNCTKSASFRTIKHDDLVLYRDALLIARSEMQAMEREKKLDHVLPERELICYHNDISVCARYASTSSGNSCIVCDIPKKSRF